MILLHISYENFQINSFPVIQTSFDKVMGKCYVLYTDFFANAAEWLQNGPFRFYFTQGYNSTKQQYYKVPSKAQVIGYGYNNKGRKLSIFSNH